MKNELTNEGFFRPKKRDFLKVTKLLSVFLIIMLMAFHASAQTSDDVLNILVQKGTITQSEADSIKAKAAAAKQDEKAKVKIFPLGMSKLFQLSGYTQIRYQTYPKANKPDGFDIRRARLLLQGSITSKWDYGIQIDFVGGSASTPAGANTTTTNTVITPTLLDAYISYKAADYLKFTAGQMLLPLSAENNVSDKVMETVDRSQVVNALVARKGDGLNGIIDSIGNQNGRDLGIQLSGSFLKIQGRYIFDYYAGLFNGAGMNEPDNNESKDFSGRLVIHPFKILTIGGSYYNGYDRFAKTPTKDQQRTRWGTELTLNYKALSIRSEFMRGQDGNDRHLAAQLTPAIHQGWYAQACYFVVPNKLQAVFKYDTYSPIVNPASPGLNKIKDANTYLIFGVNYFFNPTVKLQADYSWRTEQGDIPAVQYNDVATIQLQLGF
ncbi:MAG TPA: porin [Ferruginibacter sp.]|nr:porin [Ferruginibacter sp.]